MAKFNSRIDRWFEVVFSERGKEGFENLTLWLAIGGFLVHLGLIGFHNLGYLEVLTYKEELFSDPISALYTPFSFILVFEVFLLVYYLPESFTTSVGKLYEIISLIVIRRIFKDIYKLELEVDWFRHPPNIAFLADTLGFLLLFFLIFLFYRLRKRKPKVKSPTGMEAFIRAKKSLALLLLPILAGLALYSLFGWIDEINQFRLGEVSEISDINKIFYNEFFTVLIIADVLLLIISFRYTDRYSLLIRNCGFVISTVLIRLSFGSIAILNISLIVFAVFFGIIILYIFNQLESLRE